MKPSDEKRKFILSTLFKQNPDFDDSVTDFLFTSGKGKGYAKLDIQRELVSMDSKHDGLLQIRYLLDTQGHGGVVLSATSGWLSSKGEDYLDDLNHAWKRKFWLMFQIYVWPIITATASGILVWYLSHK